jgi:L-fuconolactonase
MPTRRQVLRTVAVAAIAGSVPARAAEPAPPAADLIIDTHQHLWDLSKLSPPWLANAPEIYRRNYRPQEYAEATEGLNVLAVYMEVDVAPADRPAEAQYVADLCRAKSGAMRVAVIGGHPAAPGFEAYVKRFAETGVVRGVRQVLHGESTPPGTCLKEAFVAGVRVLGTLGLAFDLCMRPAELADAVKLAELAPDTRFVIDHCGNADPRAFGPGIAGERPSHDAEAWKRDMAALAKRPNTICKISGVVARAPEKWTAANLAAPVNYCLDTFGPDRVVFGGDWPVCLTRATLASWIGALKEIVAKRPEGERAKLWAGNAKKFYGLDA